MDKEITLEEMPERILEEIFAFITNKNHLKLACKRFNEIISNSSKLLKDEWLSVDNTLTLSSSNINYPYQKLKIHSMGALELYWMSKYQHKNRIKAIRITGGQRCPIIMQYIISNFESLEELDFSMDRFYDEFFFMTSNMNLVPNKQSKLATLRIGYFQNDQYNLLEMFAKIPSIKNIYIHDFNELKFPLNAEWKLEKLIMTDRNEPEWEKEIDNENCKQMLLNHQETLKELRCCESRDYSAFIMKNLLNLESLFLDIKRIGNINDEFLVSDQKLQHLGLNFMAKVNLKALKVLLTHYKNVQRICLITDEIYVQKMPVLDIEYENLTQLFLKTPLCFLILNAKLPKLKVLGLFFMNETYDFDQLSGESLKNVEKLSISEFGAKFAKSIVQKCPKLVHLNFEFRDWYGQVEDFIYDIMEMSPVYCFGICMDNLKDQENCAEFIINAVNDEIKLTIFNDFTDMIADDWGRDYADHLYFR